MHGADTSALTEWTDSSLLQAVLDDAVLQSRGLKCSWHEVCAGILGDDMGLGKTLTCTSFLAGMFARNSVRRALIVAPKTLLVRALQRASCLLVLLLQSKCLPLQTSSTMLRIQSSKASHDA